MTGSLRHPDWDARLSTLLQDRMLAPFCWGPNDCAALGTEAALAVRGADVLAELRVPRASRWEALRQLARLGGLRAVLLRAGLQPAPAASARPGDLVLLAQDDWPVLAVCVGQESLAPGEQGLEAAPLTQALEAWPL